MNIIDSINQHQNNNPIELAKLLLEQGLIKRISICTSRYYCKA